MGHLWAPECFSSTAVIKMSSHPSTYQDKKLPKHFSGQYNINKKLFLLLVFADVFFSGTVQQCSCPARTSDVCSAKSFYLFPEGIIDAECIKSMVCSQYIQQYCFVQWVLQRYFVLKKRDNLFLKLIQTNRVKDDVIYLIVHTVFWSKPL